MTRLRRRFLLVLGAALAIPVVLLAFLWVHSWLAYTPSKILDFHPTDFQAKTEKEFFYSIGDELKYSNEINPEASTLLRGQIRNFLVSPDSKRIAVVANGLLMVVSAEDPIIRRVVAVDSIYRDPKPIGQQFFRDDDFQWSRDSDGLYLIKDEYYNSKGSQLFSGKGELWRYDIQKGSMQPILKPFPAYNYFLGRNSGIYFSVPTDAGDLQLKYFDGGGVRDVGSLNAFAFPVGQLSAEFAESPFFSFSIIDYENIVGSEKGVALVGQPGGPQKLEIANRTYLSFTQGEGLKGPFYCSDMLRSVFLPGDRFFLFNTPYCGNFNGQLLIDTVRGDYERLPRDTRVYISLNTDTDPHYRITGAGMLAK
jgi:hypothetical protein